MTFRCVKIEINNGIFDKNVIFILNYFCSLLLWNTSASVMIASLVSLSEYKEVISN